mgnify:CR=1 FL=1
MHMCIIKKTQNCIWHQIGKRKAVLRRTSVLNASEHPANLLACNLLSYKGHNYSTLQGEPQDHKISRHSLLPHNDMLSQKGHRANLWQKASRLCLFFCTAYEPQHNDLFLPSSVRCFISPTHRE